MTADQDLDYDAQAKHSHQLPRLHLHGERAIDDGDYL
jgi:hypothetical protein